MWARARMLFTVRETKRILFREINRRAEKSWLTVRNMCFLNYKVLEVEVVALKTSIQAAGELPGLICLAAEKLAAPFTLLLDKAEEVALA